MTCISRQPLPFDITTRGKRGANCAITIGTREMNSGVRSFAVPRLMHSGLPVTASYRSSATHVNADRVGFCANRCGGSTRCAACRTVCVGAGQYRGNPTAGGSTWSDRRSLPNDAKFAQRKPTGRSVHESTVGLRPIGRLGTLCNSASACAAGATPVFAHRWLGPFGQPAAALQSQLTRAVPP